MSGTKEVFKETRPIPSMPRKPGISVNKLIRASAVLFALWGLLHILAGIGGMANYLNNGPVGALSIYGGEKLHHASHTLMLANGIGLNYSIDLAAFGILGIWCAVLIWKGQRLGFWLSTIILGIADAAFVLALIRPGYISVSNGILGPLLYVLGVICASLGFFFVSP